MKDYPNAWISANTMSFRYNFIDSIISSSPENKGDPILLPNTKVIIIVYERPPDHIIGRSFAEIK